MDRPVGATGKKDLAEANAWAAADLAGDAGSSGWRAY